VDTKLSNHMASAGDCCAPKRADGKLLWTNIYAHMLLDPIGTPPAEPATNETCACTWKEKNFGLKAGE
jgi:hypothetical protein